MASVNFMEALEKTLTQQERGLLRELLDEKNERTDLQKLFDKYDEGVRDERRRQEELRAALETLVSLEDEEERESFIYGTLAGLVDNCRCQADIVDEIVHFVTWQRWRM